MDKILFNLVPFKEEALPIDIQAELNLNGSNIEIHFLVKGQLDNILLGDKEEIGRRVIGLWESTCFECFVLNNETLSYYEFNFSPEGHWNSFYFPKKKSPLKEALSFKNITTEVQHQENTFSLKASIDLYCFMPSFWKENQMSFGLTTVIECKNKLSYWAINHLDKKPNFHNFQTFQKVEF
jgi:hypothetical protein